MFRLWILKAWGGVKAMNSGGMGRCLLAMNSEGMGRCLGYEF